jgi:peptidyl-prolyl cis-trans isomerase B (cyclophilin B)
MKTLIFFDVDNTLYNNKLGTIPSETIRLIEKLKENDQIVLGLATGRSLIKLKIIQDIIHHFKYLVLINGSVIYENDQMLHHVPIELSDIEDVIHYTQHHQMTLGMCALHDEAVNSWDHRVEIGMQSLRGISPKVDPNFYEKHAIYQLWIFADQEAIYDRLTTDLPKFKAYPWHIGGADFLYTYMNKAYGIRYVLDHEPFDRLICIGDGANDIQMIEMADIGIAMDNSRFQELKEKADYVAPHIMDNQLYAFFKKIQLI